MRHALLALFLVGCGGEAFTMGDAVDLRGGDPGNDAGIDARPSHGDDDASGAVAKLDASSPADGDPESAADGGSPACSTNDAGPFSCLAPYVPTAVAVSARQEHASHPTAIPSLPPGSPCLSCHVAGGLGVPFLAAGWIGLDGGAGAPGLEVGLGAGSSAISVYTDADGFFWFPGTFATSATSFAIGVRSSTHELDMMGRGSGDCPSCHISPDEVRF